MFVSYNSRPLRSVKFSNVNSVLVSPSAALCVLSMYSRFTSSCCVLNENAIVSTCVVYTCLNFRQSYFVAPGLSE